MRYCILVVAALFLASCSPGMKTLNYDYLPKCNYNYYEPLNIYDLKGKSYKLAITDKRNTDKISCSKITIAEKYELHGQPGYDFFSSYLKGMIEKNNGKIDAVNGQEISVDLTGMYCEVYGSAYIRIFGLVAFDTTVDGQTKQYCTEMASGDEDSPTGGMELSNTTASRKVMAGALRRAFEQFMRDLSEFN